MKFSQMPYQRPDAAKLKKEIESMTRALREAKSFDSANEIFLKEQTWQKHVQTLNVLAHIRHSIDTRDAFYDAEAEFWNDLEPEIEEYTQKWTKAMLESPFRAQFEQTYGSIVFVNAQIDLRTFSPEIIPLLQEENRTAQEYEKLIASAQIPFEGGVYTISQLAPFKNDADDDLRRRAWIAEGTWYKENQDRLDAQYDKLVRLRDQMGKILGHENFVPLGYDRMGRNCYTKQDVEAFRKAVRDYLVPVADGIYREQAKRLGKPYPMDFADNALLFRSGNARPQGDADAILDAGRQFYDELSPQTSVFFRMMLENELLDVLSTEGKEGGGYCEGIREYGVPFIFANFNGTRDDVETVTHEAGHAFADWTNRDRLPVDTISPSLEGCEVHSMSMEFFAWKWAKLFFGNDTRKFLYSHLAGAITFIPYGTMVDHFQHIVYENPSLTPRQRHDEWKRLLGMYMPWVKLDPSIPFYGEGEGWQRQHHIYSYPFYYIDYCLAQTVALELWAMMQDDFSNAWDHYMAYTAQGGSRTFTELLRNAELQSPFDANCLKTVCEKANAFLEAYDLTGLE